MKVLIISHLPVATQNNMGKTLLSLFSAFEREEICQLYIYPAIPDVDRCASFYRVTDKDVLKSVMVGKPGGEIPADRIHPMAGLYENPEDESFYRSRKNKTAVRRLLRDAMWAVSRWNNSRLKKWLDREKPDCIFSAPAQATFIHNITLKIARERNIPIIYYICDEYYFVNRPSQKLDQFRLKFLQSKIRELMGQSSHIAVISRELGVEYGAEFHLPVDVLMTGSNQPVSDSPRISEDAAQISYFGNIRCNRYISLAEVGRELDRINEELGSDYRLKIYTSEKDPKILECFSDIVSVELCGFLTGAAFQEAFGQAQLLLHVEAFDKDSIDYVRHSVSTKIADSLASGIPLLAYGPEQISSMQHLIRNDCALTATSRDQLRKMLLTAFSDQQRKELVTRNALETAEKYHNSAVTSRRLKEIVKEVTR